MRSRIYIRGCVCPSVRPSHTSWISEKWADFEQNSVRNMKLCHWKDNSEASTLADRQDASVVWTLFNLFFQKFVHFDSLSNSSMCMWLRSFTMTTFDQWSCHCLSISVLWSLRVRMCLWPIVSTKFDTKRLLSTCFGWLFNLYLWLYIYLWALEQLFIRCLVILLQPVNARLGFHYVFTFYIF